MAELKSETMVQRNPALDLVRAVAIVWVMVFHAHVMGYGSAFPSFTKWGWVGVELFFVLSGFLIGHQVFKACESAQGFSFADFYLRRAFRILPAFLVILVLYFNFPGLREAKDIQPLWQFLTFTENFLIDYSSDKTFTHVWSLCVEEHFYLVFPFIVLCALKTSFRMKCAGFLTILFAGIFLRGGIWLANFSDSIDPVSHLARPGYRYFELLYYPSHTRMDGLLFGTTMAAIFVYRPSIWRRVSDHPFAVAIFTLLMGIATWWMFQDRFGFPATTIGFPVLSLALAGTIFLAASRGFRIPLLQPAIEFVAAISYSLYLGHKMSYVVTRNFLHHFPSVKGGGELVAYALGTLLIALPLYFLVERPFLKLRNRLIAVRKRKLETSAKTSATLVSQPLACATAVTPLDRSQ